MQISKQDFIKIVHENEDFWKLVDFINWRALTIKGRDDYSEYMEKAKQKLRDFIKIKIRKDKLKKINNPGYSAINIHEYDIFYFKLLTISNKFFYDCFLDKNKIISISDDGYWDLRSSVIGYGKDFLIKCINDKQIFIDLANQHDYYENFGYIFDIKYKNYDE